MEDNENSLGKAKKPNPVEPENKQLEISENATEHWDNQSDNSTEPKSECHEFEVTDDKNEDLNSQSGNYNTPNSVKPEVEVSEYPTEANEDWIDQSGNTNGPSSEESKDEKGEATEENEDLNSKSGNDNNELNSEESEDGEVEMSEYVAVENEDRNDQSKDEQFQVSEYAAKENEEWNNALLSTILLVSKHCRCPLCHLFLIHTSCLVCGHVFCDFCIKQWFRHDWCCPICQKGRNRFPLASRVWMMDHFLSDFHDAILEYMGDDWFPDPILPFQYQFDGWTLESLQEQVKNYIQGKVKVMLLSPDQREYLIRIRSLYLMENPVDLSNADEPEQRVLIREEFPHDPNEDEYPFPMVWGLRFWFWVGLALLIHNSEYFWNLGFVGKFLVSVLITIATRIWFYMYEDLEDEPVPRFKDWIIIQNAAKKLNEVREIAPLTDRVNWNEVLKTIRDNAD